MLIALSLSLALGCLQETPQVCERHRAEDIAQVWLPAPERGRRESAPVLVVMTDIRCSKCLAALPEGAVMTINGTPRGYRIIVQADMLSFGTGEGINIFTTNAEVGESEHGRGQAGRLDFEGPVETPGFYDVTTALLPDYQFERRPVQALKDFFHAPRDENEIEFLNFENHLVLAGNPSLVLEAQRPHLQSFWRMLQRASQILDEIEDLGRAGQGDDLEAKGRLIDQLVEIRMDALRERPQTLLTGSFGLLVSILDDVKNAAEYIQRLLEFEAATQGGAGGGGPSEPDDNWVPSELADGTHEDPPPAHFPPVDAGSYGGALNLGNMKAMLELAPVFGLRELLLWYLRISRLGADEVGDAVDAWIAAEGSAKTEAQALVEQHLAVWTGMWEAVDERTFEGLATSTAAASRRFQRQGWSDLLREFPTAYWPLVDQYFQAARSCLADPEGAQAREDFARVREQIKSESERMHSEIGKTSW